MSARLIASRIIKTVVEDKQQLGHALEQDKDFCHSGQDKAWIQEVCYGTLRWYLQLEHLLSLLLDKPIRKKDSILKFLLIGALYQLRYMQVPDYAVVSETVHACKKVKKEFAKGMINAVLRRYQREYTKLEASLTCADDIAFAHPHWLINRMKQDWPDNYIQMLNANNNKPPMYLRCNIRLTSRSDYLSLLKQTGIIAENCQYTDNGIRLSAPCTIDKLPGFADGLVSVQDQAAQLASHQLDLKPGQRVLDACAAPGGKTAAILELESGLSELIAIEKDGNRAKKIEETLERLKVSARIDVYDLLDREKWWDRKYFDRILLDAPCSATGVIRRHSDIKLLRTELQVKEVNKLQKQLLNIAWSVLKPGGLLLYATCSVLKQEHSDTIREFIAENTNGCIVPIELPFAVDTDYGTQILTGSEDMDGFFYAAIKKITNDS